MIYMRLSDYYNTLSWFRKGIQSKLTKQSMGKKYFKENQRTKKSLYNLPTCAIENILMSDLSKQEETSYFSYHFLFAISFT